MAPTSNAPADDARFNFRVPRFNFADLPPPDALDSALDWRCHARNPPLPLHLRHDTPETAAFFARTHRHHESAAPAPSAPLLNPRHFGEPRTKPPQLSFDEFVSRNPPAPLSPPAGVGACRAPAAVTPRGLRAIDPNGVHPATPTSALRQPLRREVVSTPARASGAEQTSATPRSGLPRRRKIVSSPVAGMHSLREPGTVWHTPSRLPRESPSLFASRNRDAELLSLRKRGSNEDAEVDEDENDNTLDLKTPTLDSIATPLIMPHSGAGPTSSRLITSSQVSRSLFSSDEKSIDGVSQRLLLPNSDIMSLAALSLRSASESPPDALPEPRLKASSVVRPAVGRPPFVPRRADPAQGPSQDSYSPTAVEADGQCREEGMNRSASRAAINTSTSARTKTRVPQRASRTKSLRSGAVRIRTTGSEVESQPLQQSFGGQLDQLDVDIADVDCRSDHPVFRGDHQFENAATHNPDLSDLLMATSITPCVHSEGGDSVTDPEVFELEDPELLRKMEAHNRRLLDLSEAQSTSTVAIARRKLAKTEGSLRGKLGDAHVVSTNGATVRKERRTGPTTRSASSPKQPQDDLWAAMTAELQANNSLVLKAREAREQQLKVAREAGLNNLKKQTQKSRPKTLRRAPATVQFTSSSSGTGNGVEVGTKRKTPAPGKVPHGNIAKKPKGIRASTRTRNRGLGSLRNRSRVSDGGNTENQDPNDGAALQRKKGPGSKSEQMSLTDKIKARDMERRKEQRDEDDLKKILGEHNEKVNNQKAHMKKTQRQQGIVQR